MHIEVNYLKDAAIYVKAKGKLDIYNTDEYLNEIKKYLGHTKELILDFSEIDYVASIGIRAIFELNSIMSEKGSMKLVNVQKEVLNIFKMTGIDMFINIENE